MSRRQTAPGVPNDYGLGSQVGTVGHGGAWGTKMSVDLDRREGNGGDGHVYGFVKLEQKDVENIYKLMV